MLIISYSLCSFLTVCVCLSLIFSSHSFFASFFFLPSHSLLPSLSTIPFSTPLFCLPTHFVSFLYLPPPLFFSFLSNLFLFPSHLLSRLSLHPHTTPYKLDITDRHNSDIRLLSFIFTPVVGKTTGKFHGKAFEHIRIYFS